LTRKERYVTFSDLRLSEPILRSLHEERYHTPTPIQAQAIPHVLAGSDLLGAAQTGTGKTAAFALPILHRLTTGKPASPAAPQHGSGHRGGSGPSHGRPHHASTRAAGGRSVRCLVLAPTRELALQIEESFRIYGRHLSLKHAVVFGGVSQHSQVQALARGVDVLVATPGRLLDLINQGCVNLSATEVLVLDEADRMLDMGFINDIRKIVARLPHQRQTLMFSATMPPEIRKLAEAILSNPASVNVAPVGSTIDKVDQSVYFVEKRNKPLLLAHLINNTAISRALVFTRTKHGADRVVKQLHAAGIRSEAIHGNKSQNARQRALTNFKSGKVAVLIASDVASRGIDVDDISHVFNFDLTHEPETYVHRIGRTARAGAEGQAISFCDSDERAYLRAIERLIRKTIRVNEAIPEFAPSAASLPEIPERAAPHPRTGGSRSRTPQHRAAGQHRTGGGSSPRGTPHRASAAATPRATHPLHRGGGRRRNGRPQVRRPM
jgi:ATP-dependent RNA helicase RhlE